MDRSEDGSLDETLPSGDYGASPLRRPTAPISEQPIAPGTYIGRYRALEPLGSGTMGLVMLAHDATLDRKVAIKLVRPDATGSSSGKQRLLREAQAMAKLSHPNVVTVFEVGTFEDRVFLAMEYVAGSTLSDWLKQPERTQRDKIGAFVAAGQGLAAAHRAGIVHRDFKPSNVLVDGEGRVRVADFGLATAPTGRAISAHDGTAPDPSSMDMTSTGVLLGTPAYMSPEQHRGEHADARADQFAFCVALYEALYRQLPFSGTTFLEYQASVLNGQLRDPPRGIDVPAHVQRALVRGLSVDPAKRYPKMDALLAELARDPTAFRVRAAVIVATVALAATLSFLLAHRGSSDPCAAAVAPLATVWDARAKAALEQAFSDSHSPGAPAAYAAVAAVLDQRLDALRTGRRDACVATAVRHEQSDELLDKRMQCVDERASETTALIAVLSDHPDADTVAKAVEAALAMPPVAQCADRAALLAAVPLPAAALRARVSMYGRELDRIEALMNAGKYVPALDEIAKVAPEIDKVDHAALRARLHFLAGDASEQVLRNQDALAEFHKAADLASAAHDDHLAAQAWIGLYGTTGYKLNKYDEAKGLESAAAAAVLRAGNDPSLVAFLENARGAVDLERGEYASSSAHFRAAYAAYGKAEAKTTHAATAINNAAMAEMWNGHYDEAKRLAEQGAAIRVELLGANHPAVADSYHQLGIVTDSMGDPAAALVWFQKSADIMTKTMPADSPHIAHAYVSLAVELNQLERPEEALDYLLRSEKIFEAHDADTHRDLDTLLIDMGQTYMALHRNKEAVAAFERASKIAEEMFGKDSLEVATALHNMADSLDDHARAGELLEKALAIREAKLEAGHPDIGRTLGDLAENTLERKDPATALGHINRALAIMDKAAPGQPVRFEMMRIRARIELALLKRADAVKDATAARDGFLAAHDNLEAATVREVLADALWANGDKRGAVAEMKAALDVIQAAKTPDTREIAKARDWLAHHH